MSAPFALRVVAGVLDVIETFFEESGVPLTPEQFDALLEARDHIAELSDFVGDVA